MFRNGVWFVACAAVAMACGGGTSPEAVDEPDTLYGLTPPEAERQVALTAYSGTRACEELEQKLEDTAVLEMRAGLESNYRWAREWWRSLNAWRASAGGQDAGAAGGSGGGGAGGAGAAASPGPNAFTTTNNQVAGVDEADFVKNDGTRIFVLSGGALYTALAWPATALSRQGKLELEGYPHQMLKHGEGTLVVFSQVFLPELARAGDYRCAELSCLRYSGNAVKVTTVDVSTLAAPRVVAEAYVPGQFQTARLVGDSVRLVLRGEVGFRYGELRTWVSDVSRYPSLTELRAAFLRMGLTNEATIRARALEDWLPRDRVVTATGSRVAPIDCGSVSIPNGSTQLGLTSVVTLDLASPGSLHRATVLARAGEVYASAQSLYVASPHWWWGLGWWSGRPAEDVTYLHRFDLSDPASSRWLASGSVRGHLVDQFSLDEHRGFLRVATTRRDFSQVQSGAWWWGAPTVSQVTVLGTFGQSLLPVGQSEDLAPGERIMSARFLGEQGYVVTFRQVDPLFTFDLSNPFQPKKLGELKVEGFSTYLHPVDATHLLGMGTLDGAVQLALYDVSDLRAPKQTHREVLGRWSYSEAQWEHKAFNYFPAQKRLAVPYSAWEYGDGWSWSRFVSELKVYDVDVDRGFTPRGALSMRELFEEVGSYTWSWYWSPSVRRSIMADDFVYAISDSGIRVAHVEALDAPLATARFDAAH